MDTAHLSDALSRRSRVPEEGLVTLPRMIERVLSAPGCCELGSRRSDRASRRTDRRSRSFVAIRCDRGKEIPEAMVHPHTCVYPGRVTTLLINRDCARQMEYVRFRHGASLVRILINPVFGNRSTELSSAHHHGVLCQQNS